MSNSSSSSPDFSRPKNGYYDVFLSFRGKDTRGGFTNNLYHSLMEKGVYTFMDVDLVGKPIDSLFEIIGTSKIAVVVYSERFASSHWCLRELETIIQRVSDKQMLILPIFYKVDVGELKDLTGETAKYLDQHVAKHDRTAVQNWKDAVTTLGNVSGLSYKDTSYERDFIPNVIKKIKTKLEVEWEETCIPKPNPKDAMECPTIKSMWQGTEECMEELRWVKSVDVHPTKPWVLLTPWITKMCIWNYETRVVEKSFEVIGVAGFVMVSSAKFVPEKHWIIAGGDDKFVRVLDYNTSEKLKEFKAHRKTINCVVVHPTLPYVLTASEDKLIKLWNWEDDWACQETFEGHSSEVLNVAFNPLDPHSFASVSRGFLKIWRIGSRVEEFTSNKDHGISSVEYFVGNGDTLYILSSDKVWHYGSKTLVQTLGFHVGGVTANLVHPELPIILTGDSDGALCIWNKNTYQSLVVADTGFGDITSFGFIKASKEVVIGCKDGMVVVKFAFAGKQSA